VLTTTPLPSFCTSIFGADLWRQHNMDEWVKV
jgi:hypothetical protein